jgi:hypothetical protein
MILLHYQRDERVEQSVNRMMTIIDLARNIRERHNKALKTPLKYVQAPLIFLHVYIFYDDVRCSAFISVGPRIKAPTPPTITPGFYGRVG